VRAALAAHDHRHQSDVLTPVTTAMIHASGIDRAVTAAVPNAIPIVVGKPHHS